MVQKSGKYCVLFAWNNQKQRPCITVLQLHWTTNFKKFFVSVMNMLLIYLFASMKLEKGHKKNSLALVLKLCYTMIFYEIG